MTKHFIGIDPGKTGGIAVIDSSGEKMFSQPFTSWIDVKKIIANYGSESTVCLEQVSSMPRQGVKSTFTFGMNFGGWIAALEILNVPYILVPPGRWQKAILGSFPKGESKARALSYVQRRYPAVEFRKKDSGVVDALCLALYCKTIN